MFAVADRQHFHVFHEITENTRFPHSTVTLSFPFLFQAHFLKKQMLEFCNISSLKCNHWSSTRNTLDILFYSILFYSILKVLFWSWSPSLSWRHIFCEACCSSFPWPSPLTPSPPSLCSLLATLSFFMLWHQTTMHCTVCSLLKVTMAIKVARPLIQIEPETNVILGQSPCSRVT